MGGELALETQFAREIGEERALALGVGIDGDARGRIDLQRLLARAHGGGEIGRARRVLELVLQECLGLRVEPGLPQPSTMLACSASSMRPSAAAAAIMARM